MRAYVPGIKSPASIVCLQMDRGTSGWMDGRTERWMNGGMEGRLDGQVDGRRDTEGRTVKRTDE